MAKKKKLQHKKPSHSKTRTPAPRETTESSIHQAATEESVVTPKASAASLVRPSTVGAAFDPAVGRDVIRTVILASGLALAQIVLWFLMTQTSLGPTVYGWVRL